MGTVSNVLFSLHFCPSLRYADLVLPFGMQEETIILKGRPYRLLSAVPYPIAIWLLQMYVPELASSLFRKPRFPVYIQSRNRRIFARYPVSFSFRTLAEIRRTMPCCMRRFGNHGSGPNPDRMALECRATAQTIQLESLRHVFDRELMVQAGVDRLGRSANFLGDFKAVRFQG